MTQVPHKGAKAPAADTDELDPTSMAAIRSLLVAEPDAFDSARTVRPARQQKPVAPPPRREAPQAAKPANRSGAARKTMPAPAPEDAAQDTAAAGVKGRLTGYRPKARHILLVCVAALIVLRPWLILGLLVLSSIMMIGVFLILGYDGFWRRAMAVARWYARRRPSRAAVLHQKLDRFAMKWDSILDRFPEGSVDGLYLPDFGELAQADARHDAAMDRRLDKLRSSQG